MVSINYATREVSCKIVYYGPGLSGKTTNLQYVHNKVPSNTKGKLISLATDADRTLYFDFLPINIGTINGFASKFQLYTVPGQVYYNATRKLVLRGVDGLVFVADSQPDKMDENIESLNNLKENLAEYGYKVDELPLVIQYNKQDLPDVMSPDEMRPVLNPRGLPDFKASATEGFGVFDTLKCILKLVLDKARAGGTAPSAQPPSSAATQDAQPTAAHAQPSPPVTPASQPQTTVPVTAVPSQPVPEPVTTMAPAAQHTQPAVPEGGVRSAPAEIGTVQTMTEEPKDDAGSEVKREPAPAETQQNDSGPVYRPFPGNTVEDETKMQQPPGPESKSPGLVTPVGGTEPQVVRDNISVINQVSKPAGKPHMAPSLKADRPRKKKKRSFFKRLFGLK